MRALLLALACLAVPAVGAAQAPTIVQAKECEVNAIGTGGAPCSFNVTPTTGSGRYVIAVVSQTSSAGSPQFSTTTDNQGNTYTTRSEFTGRCKIASAPITTASGTFTTTFAHGADQFGITNAQVMLFEISGLNASNPLDNADADGTSGSSTSPSVNLANTAQAAFIVGGFTWEFVAFTGSAGWTQQNHAAEPLTTLYRTEAAAGAFDPGGTIDFSNTWSACGAAFAAAGGGGGGTINLPAGSLPTLGVGGS